MRGSSFSPLLLVWFSFIAVNKEKMVEVRLPEKEKKSSRILEDRSILNKKFRVEFVQECCADGIVCKGGGEVYPRSKYVDVAG